MAQQQERLVTRIAKPDDMLAAIPPMLGFHPQNSLVVVGAGGPRNRVKLGFRYDLPDPPHAEATNDIVGHALTVLAEQKLTVAIVVGYGPGKLVTPLADAFRSQAGPRGIQIHDLLRVEDGRYWSYLCGDVRCCPAEGTPFDLSTHPATRTMAEAGLTTLATREQITAKIAGPDQERNDALKPLYDDVCDEVSALVAKARAETRERELHPAPAEPAQANDNPLRHVIHEGRRVVKEAIDTYRSGGSITDDRTIAKLAVFMSHLAVRDDAWARMDPEHRDTHLRLWTDVVKATPDLWAAPPLSLLAFVAWQCGDGTLAGIALERAVTAEPDYSMAQLLREVIYNGIPPSLARAPMTPEEVAESYGI